MEPQRTPVSIIYLPHIFIYCVVRDFFAFCGEISVLHLYSVDGGRQEAVVKFETESASSTACLLNNAVIDGNNVKVEMFPVPEESDANGSAYSNNNNSATNFSPTLSGVFSGLKSLTSSVVEKVKAVDQQYGVSTKVAAGAATAWDKSKTIASDINEKYRVQEHFNSAVESTRKNATSLAGKISESINKK